MDFWGTRRFVKLALACIAVLAVPGTAAAATFTINCGTFAPLDLPSTGQLDYVVTGATEGADYAATSGSVPCAAGPGATHTVTVDLLDDSLDEPQETLTMTISKGALFTGEIATAAASTKIADDDVPDASIVSLVRILEGDPATPAAQLTVALSQVPVEQATINYATDDSSALAGSDFTGGSGQLVIPAGQQSGMISVPILDDAAVEKVEAFYVNLGSAANATVNATKKQAAVAIFDSDKAPVPSLSLPKGVAVKEGASGTVNALFTVNLSSAATERVQVAWKTANFTADLADYASGRGTLVFEPGQTSKTISVNVKGDRRDEPSEAYAVALEKPVGATLGAAKSFGIIVDDDGPKLGIARPKVVRKRTLVLNVACPASADLCKGRLTAVAGKLKFGAAAFELAKGQTGKLRLKMSRKARAALRKRARRVTFTALAADRSGATRLTVRKFRLSRLR
jgi:hypothetical protein